MTVCICICLLVGIFTSSYAILSVCVFVCLFVCIHVRLSICQLYVRITVCSTSTDPNWPRQSPTNKMSSTVQFRKSTIDPNVVMNFRQRSAIWSTRLRPVDAIRAQPDQTVFGRSWPISRPVVLSRNLKGDVKWA